MTATKQRPSAVEQAVKTAKWARTMTKWLVTYSYRSGARWQLVEFGGKMGSEARGIVDIIAIRKNHRGAVAGLKRGDLFEVVLIQTKGGSARLPTMEDKQRLARVARYHRAKAVVLAEWKRGRKLSLRKLVGSEWKPVDPGEVFA